MAQAQNRPSFPAGRGPAPDETRNVERLLNEPQRPASAHGYCRKRLPG